MSGAWFYDLEVARRCAKGFELLIPVEFPNWPDVQNDSNGSDGDLAHLPAPGISIQPAPRIPLPVDEPTFADEDSQPRVICFWGGDCMCPLEGCQAAGECRGSFAAILREPPRPTGRKA